VIHENSLKNLQKGKNTQFRSGDDAANKGSKGGKKSQQVQAEKRKAAELARMVLALTPEMPSGVAKQIRNLGIKDKKPEAKLIAIAAQMQHAMAGNIKSLEFLLQLAGDTPDPTALDPYGEYDQPTQMDDGHIRKTLDAMSDDQLRNYQEICHMFSSQPDEEEDDE